MSGTEGARAGGCLCGAVRFTATPTKPKSSVCHCGMCRRWTGTAFLGVDVAKDIAIEGEASLGRYVSSDIGERQFCAACGSTLFWRKRDGSMVEVALGAFDDPSGLPLRTELFIDAKPDSYSFAGEHRLITEAQFRELTGGANG